MAIDTTLPPTVAEFRAMFPEFSDVDDAHIQVYLDIAMEWVDTYWFPRDAKVAVMYAAAHFLSLHDQASGGEISGEGEVGGGGVVDPELGKIWVKTVRFRDRQVTYDRVGTDLQKQSGGSGASASSEEFWEATPYGQMYLSYRRRNVAHIAVI